MKFDDIIAELGEFGPYQKLLYYMVCLAGIPTALQTMNIVFTMAYQSHRCAIPWLDNDTYAEQGPWHADLIKTWVPWDEDEDEYDTCDLFKKDPTTQLPMNATMGCSNYVYDTDVFKTSLFSEFELVCDDKSLKTYANMVFMGGLLFGSLILGSLADIIGRKKVMLFGVCGHFCVSLSAAFVTSYIPFVILRFFTAFCGVGLFLAAFVVGMEIVGPSKRQFAGIIIEMFWAGGLLFNALLGYLIREWKYLQIATSIPSIFLLSYAVVLPESPRWLINKGRLDEASKILEKAAKGNKVTLSEKARNLENLETEGRDEKIWQMFTNSTLLFRSLIVFFNWLVASMVYYGLSLNVGALSGDIHLNYSLSCLVEGASYVFCLFLLDRAGRKPMQCGTMLVAGVACLCTMFPVMFGAPKWINVVLSLIGKFGASAAFAVIYVYSAELFPTAMRNSGMGISSFTARIGGIVSPYIADLGDQIEGDFGTALPLIIFGGTSIVAGLMALSLPETTNRILPDTVEDAVNFGKQPAKNTYALNDMANTDKPAPTKGQDNPSFQL